MDTLFSLPALPAPANGQTCVTCKQVKPLDCFQLERQRATGEGSFYKHRCKDCCKSLGRTQRMLGKRHRLELYYEQKGCCALCDRPEDPNSRPLGLDHCHHTGRVRGLLDMRCNTALGLLGLDCPPEQLDERLMRIRTYLLGKDETGRR